MNAHGNDQDGDPKPSRSPRDPSDDEGGDARRNSRHRHRHRHHPAVVDEGRHTRWQQPQQQHQQRSTRHGRDREEKPSTPPPPSSSRRSGKVGNDNNGNGNGNGNNNNTNGGSGGRGGGVRTDHQRQTTTTGHRESSTSLGRFIGSSRPVEVAASDAASAACMSALTIPSTLLRGGGGGGRREDAGDDEGGVAHRSARRRGGMGDVNAADVGQQRGVTFRDDVDRDRRRGGRRPSAGDGSAGSSASETTLSAELTRMLPGYNNSNNGNNHGALSLSLSVGDNPDRSSSGSSNKRRRPWFASSGGPGGAFFAASAATTTPASSAVTGVKYRSATSTRLALEELRRKRVEWRERRRAMALLAGLLAMALALHFFGGRRGSGDAGVGAATMKAMIRGGGKDGASAASLEYGGERIKGDVVETAATADSPPTAPGGEGAAGGGVGEGGGEGGEGGGVGVGDDVGDYEYKLPMPVEKTYDPEHEYLSPLRHFSDLSDPHRPDSDTAFFFHVPRSGGSTVKTILGKCLRLVQASEVGVRDGHGTDPSLQVLEVQESRFVNVDTTTVPGIQRAVDMGLVASGLADVVVSSYLHESAAVFDLDHQGRAFIVMRDPIERATSMYYHRVKTLGNLDAATTIEDYAQGNGIENNWMCRFLANRMSGELTKEDLDQAKEVLKTKFTIGFLDDLEESVHQVMKFNGWKYSDDETAKMKQEDCIRELTTAGGGTNRNAHEYEIPKRGSQAHALISWQTQFDSKLYAYAKELFDHQTKEWGTKDRKKALKKEKKNKGG
jgi:hypothetical protein